MLGSLLQKLRGIPEDIPQELRPPLVLEPSKNAPDATPDLAEPCFCGSQKFFKSCCGSLESRRKAPYGLFVVENYLSAKKIAEIRSYADSCEGKRLMVIDAKSSTKDELKLMEDERRVSELVNLGSYQTQINELVGNAFVELCQRFTPYELEWYERPQMLRYRPGGFYIRHSDSENMDPQTRTWTKSIDRDFSMLIYLNDDFEGGELFFSKFNYRLKPKAGMAVLFPSDHRYIHEACNVTKGIRYALVSWGAARGVKKVMTRPPESIIRC
ncbi:MAG: 2OG-Fe(II) oxygenase [Gammaproteobacteria bacterium]|nr:2OG-Fe(II) oxygenase [Gammaproteobacteria bacterium]